MPPTPKIAPHAHIAVNPDHLVAELGGDLVIMSVKTGTYYGLDAVGAYVWKLVEQPRSFASIVEGVLDHFEAERETVEADLAGFLSEMQAEGIVSVTEDNPAQSK